MTSGSCLCGAVTLTVEGEFEHQPEICHCRQCRKQTGHYLAGVNVRKTRLRISGEDSVAWYRSSEKVERGFCRTCGSTLFWAPNMPDYEWLAVAMGLFDENTGLRLIKQTFVGDKGDYYDLPDGIPQSEAY